MMLARPTGSGQLFSPVVTSANLIDGWLGGKKSKNWGRFGTFLLLIVVCSFYHSISNYKLVIISMQIGMSCFLDDDWHLMLCHAFSSTTIESNHPILSLERRSPANMGDCQYIYIFIVPLGLVEGKWAQSHCSHWPITTLWRLISLQTILSRQTMQHQD